MLQFLKRFFNKPAASTTVETPSAPYKVEAPAPVTESKSDGGIWPFPTVAPVVESAPYQIPEPAATTPIPLVPAKKTPAAKKAPAVKTAPAKKTPAAKKAPAQPRVKKTPNK